MKKVFILLLGLLFIVSGLAIASEKAHWGYSGDTGPENWSKLSEEYAMCGIGKNQSPVDITGMVQARMKKIEFNYGEAPLEVLNNGHTIQVNYAGESTIGIDGKTFKLLQFHFHAPSENHINGKSFPMEAHLVHADKDGNLAVIAVMFQKGGQNALLSAIWKQMPEKVGETKTLSDVTIDVMDMLPENKAYYRFNGSLTTPPCTEGVRWLVLKGAVWASVGQVQKFRSVMQHDNNRPIQPINARPVLR